MLRMILKHKFIDLEVVAGCNWKFYCV